MTATKANTKRSTSTSGLPSPADQIEQSGTETAAFGLDGVWYEVDLSLPYAALLRETLANFVKAEGQTPTSARTPGPQAGVARFVDATTDVVHRLLTSRTSTSPDLLESEPAALAEQMVASIPTRHAYDQLVGPFYDTTGLRKWLGLSRQALASRVEAGSLLACTTQDGQLVYPAWQFRPDGTTVPHLPALIKILRKTAATSWTVATWLRAPGGEDVNGMDAVSWLAGGGDPAPLLADAHDDAARWAS